MLSEQGGLEKKTQHKKNTKTPKKTKTPADRPVLTFD
jgi:hypothetical protein